MATGSMGDKLADYYRQSGNVARLDVACKAIETCRLLAETPEEEADYRLLYDAVYLRYKNLKNICSLFMIEHENGVTNADRHG